LRDTQTTLLNGLLFLDEGEFCLTAKLRIKLDFSLLISFKSVILLVNAL